MGYGVKIYQAACKELEDRRRRAEEKAAACRERFFEDCPQAGAQIREEMARNASGAARAVLSGGDVRQELTRMKERGMALREEYNGLLAQSGLSLEDVTPQYQCPNCRDSGFVDGRMCQCLKSLQRRMAYERLSMDAPLESCTFESFSLEYYQEDERCTADGKVFRACQSYGENCGPTLPACCSAAEPAWGKTHLSLAIAGKAIEKGMGVIYGSAQSFAVALEKERFDREPPEEGDTNTQLTECDLLILDDLGTEFPSAYVNAALYNIINSRMLAERPTIISTNLTLKELESRYSERFASRIAGYYGKLEFLGNDVRVQKRLQKSRKHP